MNELIKVKSAGNFPTIFVPNEGKIKGRMLDNKQSDPQFEERKRSNPYFWADP